MTPPAPSGEPRLNMSGARAIITFFAIALAALIVAALLGGLILSKGATTGRLRVFTVVQDVVVFILPAVITALLVTRRPADLLGLTARPGLAASLTAILTLLVATPAMNWLVAWNESLTLPASLSGLEEAMQQSEQSAREMVEMMMGGTSVADLIMGILVIGIMAGLSEEIFFRGGLMRIMIRSGMNAHLAIWITAVVFSLFHFQFYGFVPRIVLGAFFGYLLLWSRSIWLPVIVHAFNNSVIVVADWLHRSGRLDYDINSAGSTNFTLILASVILTIGLLRAMKKHLFRKEDVKEEIKG